MCRIRYVGNVDDLKTIVIIGNKGVLPIRGKRHVVGIVRIKIPSICRIRWVGYVDNLKTGRASGNKGILAIRGKRHAPGVANYIQFPGKRWSRVVRYENRPGSHKIRITK